MRELPEHDDADVTAGYGTASISVRGEPDPPRPGHDGSGHDGLEHDGPENDGPEHAVRAPDAASRGRPPEQRPGTRRDGAHRQQDHAQLSSALSASVAHRLLPAAHATVEEGLPRRYRVLLGCTLAVCALFSCVAVGRITADGMEPAPRVRSAPVSGHAALRPDVLAGYEWPFTGAGSTEEREDVDPGAESSAAPIVRAEAPLTDVANPAAGSRESAVRVAEEFYRRLADAPGTAADLLAPSLRGGDPDGLARAWSAADRIQHRVRGGETGHRAVVRVQADFPDGRQVVLHQQLTVEAGSDPRIRDVELLSGRYNPPR